VKTLKCWIEVNSTPLLGYSQTFYLLVRGWINFYLKGVVDVETILEVLWKKGPMSLLVKMWMDFFDAKI